MNRGDRVTRANIGPLLTHTPRSSPRFASRFPRPFPVYETICTRVHGCPKKPDPKERTRDGKRSGKYATGWRQVCEFDTRDILKNFWV